MKKRFIVIVLTAVLITGISGQISGQSNEDGSMPQYLFGEFSKSTVKFRSGQVQTSLMNYNIVTEKMVFIKDDKYFDLMNPESVDTIFLNDSRFIPAGRVFHEVMVSAPVSFFIQHKGNLMPAGKPAAYGGTSQLSSTTRLSSISLSSGQYNLKLPADYIVSSVPLFWIRKDNIMNSFETEKQFLKLFPGKEGKIKEYMKENRLKFSRPENLATVVSYINTLE